MKPLGYFGIKEFAVNAEGPFGCFDVTKRDRAEVYWSDEDFGFVLYRMEGERS